MNCFDCAGVGHSVPAVAICVDCGAGMCMDHARLSVHSLTRTALINRVEVVEPPRRTLRCAVCQSAHDAARRAAS